MNTPLESITEQSKGSQSEIRLADLKKQLEISELGSLQESAGLPFSSVVGPERDHAVLQMLSRLKVKLEESGPHRQKSWEAGWKENLDKVKNAGVSPENLQPGYCHYKLYRYMGGLIKSNDPLFESKYNEMLRPLIFKKFLASFSRLVEFGSGTGSTLLLLSKLFPEKEIWGSDWATSSVDLCNLLSAKSGAGFKAFQFDYFKASLPESVSIDANTGILTTHSMEQIGGNFGTFLDFLLREKPGLCVHLEPIEEFYDKNDLLDYLACEYHDKRKYLSGYLTGLRELEKVGKVEIIFAKRLGFGTLFHEGYSLVAWKPLI